VVVSYSGGGKASLNGSATIVSALTANFLRACGSTGKCSVEQGCVSVCGGFGFQGGGSAPYSYQLTGGSVPPGTYQYGLSLAGTFTRTGTYNFKATITDGNGATASLSPTFTVFPHISFAGGTVTCPYNGCASAQTLPYQGGAGTPSVQAPGWTTTCTFPPCYKPPKPAVSASAGLVSVNVPPSGGGNGYQGTLTLVLTDKSSCGAGTYCSVSGTVSVVVQSG
jgi:hypothetical protein